MDRGIAIYRDGGTEEGGRKRVHLNSETTSFTTGASNIWHPHTISMYYVQDGARNNTRKQTSTAHLKWFDESIGILHSTHMCHGSTAILKSA